MIPVAESHKIVARAAATAFGGKPEVQRFSDKDESHQLDLLICSCRPSPGFTTFSTVTLHGASNTLDGASVPVELAAVAESSDSNYPRMLATAGFCVQKDGWLAAPGVVFPSLLEDYQLSPTLSHVLWVPPFPWEELNSVPIGDGVEVHWLLGVPISESERRFLLEHGFEQLEMLFAQHEIEFFDLERSPVV